MAGSLDMTVYGSPERGITVKWMEPQKAQFNRGGGLGRELVVCLIVIGCLALSVTSFAGGSFGAAMFWMLINAPIAIAGFLWKTKTDWVSNEAHFTRKTVSTSGGTVPTDRITRFDYGIRSQLTGNLPLKDFQGDPLPDPFIIRMWIGDAQAITVSTNNWESGVNHTIRDALDKALQQVRTAEKKAIHDQKYGRVEDNGIPNYD